MDKKLLEEITVKHFTIKEYAEALRFYPKPKPCNRCGDFVEDQKLVFAKKLYDYRPQFWEIKCNRCDLKITVKDLTKFKKE